MGSSGKDFKQRMLAETAGRLGDHHFGALRQETAVNKAEGIISQELGRLGWTVADLASRRKGGPAKLQIAASERSGTTLSVKQIAARLHLGTVRSASERLRATLRQPAPTVAAHPVFVEQADERRYVG